MSGNSNSAPRTRRRTAKDKHRVIYCIEGVYRQDDNYTIDRRSQDISFRSALEYLRDMDYWDFRHRDVATVEELEFFLTNEWVNCLDHSILHITSHGRSGRITLSEEVEIHMTDSLDDNPSLASMLEGQLGHCHIHFSGCSVMKSPKGRKKWIDAFCEETYASVVSGYEVDIAWSDRNRPAALADIFLFSQLSGVDYYKQSSYPVRLETIQREMDQRFNDCKFAYELGEVYR